MKPDYLFVWNIIQQDPRLKEFISNCLEFGPPPQKGEGLTALSSSLTDEEKIDEVEAALDGKMTEREIKNLCDMISVKMVKLMYKIIKKEILSKRPSTP